ncbi:hypothetical protein ACPA54_04245 [Uniformispora flossi]
MLGLLDAKAEPDVIAAACLRFHDAIARLLNTSEWILQGGYRSL